MSIVVGVLVLAVVILGSATSPASCSTFNVPCPIGQSVNPSKNCAADPCVPGDQSNCCDANGSSSSCTSFSCPTGTTSNTAGTCAESTCTNQECCLGTQKEFEQCKADGTSGSELCGQDLTCQYINRFYSQCKGTNNNCDSQSISISPSGLSGASISLDVWFVTSGGTANVTCSQAGAYRGEVSFVCDSSGTLQFDSGDCEPEDYCDTQSVTYNDNTGANVTFSAWFTAAGDSLMGPCDGDKAGYVEFYCPSDSSEGTVGTLQYVKDTCVENCFGDNAYVNSAQPNCTINSDCCGNLVCKSETCIPQCTLPSDWNTTIDNVDSSATSCSGQVSEEDCDIQCNSGFDLYGCPQCMVDGQDFDVNNIKCVASGSTPECDCSENFYISHDRRHNNMFCQGPNGHCLDRHGQTQDGSGRCGAASALEIHWGIGGTCQLAWECELTNTCATEGWNDTVCNTAANVGASDPVFYEARTTTSGIACGTYRECSVDLCCEEVTCERWRVTNPCTGSLEDGPEKTCVEGVCDVGQCCQAAKNTTCSDYLTSSPTACTSQGLTTDPRNVDHLCYDGSGHQAECAKVCCAATCGTATLVPANDTQTDGLCRCTADNPNACFDGQVPMAFESSYIPTHSDVVCGKTNEECDPLLCCEYASCADVFESEASFCSSVGLQRVEFEYSPCGRNVTDCEAMKSVGSTVNSCCEATCSSYWVGASACNGNSTLNRIPNANKICGPTVSFCSYSSCCYTPEEFEREATPGGGSGAPGRRN